MRKFYYREPRRNQIFVCLYGRTLWPLAGCTKEENSRNSGETGGVFRRLQLTPSLNSLVVERFLLSSRSIFGVTYVCHCFHCSEMAKESIYGYVWISLLSISGQNQVKQGCGVVTKQLFMQVPHFTPLYCTVYTCIQCFLTYPDTMVQFTN